MARAWKDAATLMLAAKFPKAPLLGASTGVAETKSVASGDSSPPDSRTNTLHIATPTMPSFDYKVLMLERSSKSPFMPSAYVFPGGKVSETDFKPRWSELFRDVFELKGLGEDSLLTREQLGTKESIKETEIGNSAPDRLPLFKYWDEGKSSNISSEVAFRICAIRETFEESGVLLCTNKDRMKLSIDSAAKSVSVDSSHLMESCLPVCEVFSEDKLAQWRNEVNADADKFIEMCFHLNIVPNVWYLHDWSCWLTPTNMNKMHKGRRYDTVFYLACLPNIQAITQDDREITSAEWIDPLELLCRYYSEELWIAPPQVYELCRLCSKPQLDELFTFAKNRERYGMERWLPVRIDCQDGVIAVLPGDELYPQDLDLDGNYPCTSLSQSISELRSGTISSHRFEFLGLHNTNIISTKEQTYGQLSPNLGHQSWQAIRDDFAQSHVKSVKDVK